MHAKNSVVLYFYNLLRLSINDYIAALKKISIWLFLSLVKRLLLYLMQKTAYNNREIILVTLMALLLIKRQAVSWNENDPTHG
jgi:hypothetical protein